MPVQKIKKHRKLPIYSALESTLIITPITDIATGCGESPLDALDDALEQLACADWDADGLETRIRADYADEIAKIKSKRPKGCSPDDHYYYLSLRVKGGAS